MIHQYCLLHLNKLIVNDFSKNTTIAQELLKYRLLNIFYNRETEIEMLRKLELEEKQIIQDEKAYKSWIKKKQFRTDRGIHFQIKLSSMKRAGMFEGEKPTILEMFKMFRPFGIH